jgi:hypothetical protein
LTRGHAAGGARASIGRPDARCSAPLGQLPALTRGKRGNINAASVDQTAA